MYVCIGGTLVSGNTEMLHKLTQYEGSLNNKVMSIILSILPDLCSDHQLTITSPTPPSCRQLLTALLDLSYSIITNPQTNSNLIKFLAWLVHFLGNCGQLLFEDQMIEKRVGDLTAQLFRLGTYRSAVVKKYSVTVVYALLRMNLDACGDLASLQVCLIITLNIPNNTTLS